MKFACYTLLFCFTLQTSAWANMDDTTDNGQIHNTTLITKALTQLGIPQKNCYCDLAVTKQLPYGNKDTVVVIPEIASMQENGEVFSLNSYILLVDSRTGKIKARYYESADSNGWDSDALALSDIKIDTARYMLTDTARAFGIRVKHTGSSKVFPFGSEALSLFLPQAKRLKQVLKNLEVESYHGEWDMNCEYKMLSHSSKLAIAPTLSHGYKDMVLTTTSKYEQRRASAKKEDECIESPIEMAKQRYKLHYHPAKHAYHPYDASKHNHITYKGVMYIESKNSKTVSKKQLPIKLSMQVLKNNDDQDSKLIVGSLQYLKSKATKPIKVIGSASYDNGRLLSVYINEFADKGNITGIFSLEPFGSGFIGVWYKSSNDDEQNTYDVSLKRTKAYQRTNTWSAPKKEWFGDYFYEYGDKGSQGGFSLKKLTNNKAKFVLTSVTSAPARNIADIESTVTLGKTGFTVKPFKNKPKCEIKVGFYKGFANVSYTNSDAYNECEFGHNATAEGVFLKVKTYEKP